MIKFATVGITSIFWIYLATFLEKNDYGMLGLLISIATIGQAVSSLGLNKTITVYGSKNSDIIFSAYSLGLVASTIVAIVTYIIIQNVFVSFLIIGLTIFLLEQAHLRSEKKFKEVSKHRIIHAVLIIALSITLYQFLGVSGIIFGYALANIPSIITFILKKKNFMNISVLKPYSGFMTGSWISELFTKLFLWGDKIVIGSLFGLTTLANFHLTIQYFMVLYNLPNAVMEYMLPHVADGNKTKKIKYMSIVFSVILVAISIIIIPYFINTFFSKYSDSIFPMMIVSFGIIPLTISAIHESELAGMGNIRFIVIGSIISVIVYFILLVVLGNILGLFGMAISFLISTVVRMIFGFMMKQVIVRN
jgi:O-antigen/teichoic acid export membrane protein